MFEQATTPHFSLSNTVLDAPDANELAAFYRRLLGWTAKVEEPGWVMLANPEGGPGLSFQTETRYIAPVWPAGEGDPQMQSHLDIRVDDLEAGSRHAVSEGAVVAAFQPQEGVIVHLDPAGHPFCLFVS